MPSDEETEIRLDARNVDERRTLRWVLGINFTQVLVAGAVGILADSAGLLGAALDNLGDAAVYAVISTRSAARSLPKRLPQNCPGFF